MSSRITLDAIMLHPSENVDLIAHREFNRILRGFLKGLHKDGFHRIVMMILRGFP